MIKDLTGRVFSRLTVVGFHHRDRRRSSQWLCKCECGNECVVRSDGLTGGRTKSCGCLRIDRVVEVQTTHGETVGGKKSVEYQIWQAIRERCYNPKTQGYSEYGGRGIRLSDDWMSYENFVRDMGRRPSKLHSIDRMDNDGDYCKGNCRWATQAQQARNTSRNVWVDTPKGRMVLADAAKEFAIDPMTLKNRIRTGMDASLWFAPAGSLKRRSKKSCSQRI